MTQQAEITTIPGSVPVLLIVPYGHRNDSPYLVETALQLQQKIDCFLIINQKWKRGNSPLPSKKGTGKRRIHPSFFRLDMNNTAQAARCGLAHEWLHTIQTNIHSLHTSYGSCQVVLLFDAEAKHLAKTKTESQIFFGAGYAAENSNKDARTTCSDLFIQNLLAPFSSVFSTRLAKAGKIKHELRYSGWKKDELNQFCYNCLDDKTTESLQITFDTTLVTEQKDEIVKLLANSLKRTEKVEKQTPPIVPVSNTNESEANIKLIETSVQTLTNIFVSHLHNALEEAGQYLLSHFFDNDIERARDKNPTRDQSFNQLIQEISSNNGDGPKKSWLFNALNLLVQEHDLQHINSFSKLNGSQKILLLSVHDESVKHQLITDCSTYNYSVRKLKERIKELIPVKQELSTIVGKPQLFFQSAIEKQLPTRYAQLNKKEQKKVLYTIEQKKSELQKEIQRQQNYLNQYTELLDQLSDVQQ